MHGIRKHFLFGFGLPICLLSLIVSLIALSGMRPVSRRTQADSYTEGNLHLTREEEQLLETKKSSRPVQSAKPAQTGKPGPLKKK